LNATGFAGIRLLLSISMKYGYYLLLLFIISFLLNDKQTLPGNN